MASDSRTRVEAVMSTPVVTISASASVRQAATSMREHDINALLVPGSQTGIITSTDVLDAVDMDEDLDTVTVADVMTVPVETITSHLMLQEAAAMMMNFGIKHLPVVDRDGEYVGMISSSDTVSVFA